MQKKGSCILFYLAILLMLIFPRIHARPTTALLNVTMTWDVVADGVLEHAELKVTVPTESANQKIISMNFSDPYKIISDSESNIKFEFGNIRAKRISANFIIQTDYIDRINSNRTEIMKKEYSTNTEYIKINDEISDIARELSGDSAPLELYNMSKWVYDNVKYNLSYTNVSISDITQTTMPSDWVIQSRTGVCDEFSNLFIAMARSKSYPTRIIIGQVYVDRKWIPHAWAETFLPEYGWIEIDPTHNQFLNLNALRVRTGTSSDISKLQDSINATSKDARTVSLQSSTTIEIINYTEINPIKTTVVFSPQPPLEQNQPTIVKIRNIAENPVFLNSMFIPPVSVDCINCSKTSLIDGGKYDLWELNLKLPPLMANVKYIFPNTVINEYGIEEASFERMQIEKSLEEKYSNIEDLPVSFKIFVGLFIIGAVAIIAIAILLGI